MKSILRPARPSYDALIVSYGDTTLMADAVCPAGNVTLSVRPESIRLADTEDEAEAENVLPVEVSYSMFLGEKVRYFLKDATGREWLADIFDPGRRIFEGKVWMYFRADRTHVITESGE